MKSHIPLKTHLHVHLISLFPNSFESYLQESIIARAIKEKTLFVHTYNPRDFVRAKKSQKNKTEPYLRVDDKPYGGGPGMVMEALPVITAIEKAVAKAQKTSNSVFKNGVFKTIFLTPGGEQFTNALAMNWVQTFTKQAEKEYKKNTHISLVDGVVSISDKDLEKKHQSRQSKKAKIQPVHMHIVCICGRYEGVDERVNQVFKTHKVSVGPFVTTGGELPAMIIIDALARQIPGVLGNFESREEARVASHEVYTRPEVLEYKGKKYRVPKVLLSGDHKKIEDWRESRGSQSGN